jgi:hypothetical protein
MSNTLRHVIPFLVTALVSGAAAAQTKSPNVGGPAMLRSWPVTGIWQTALARRADQTLGCVMLSAHKDNGRIEYLAGIRQLPHELAILINDRSKMDIDGAQIRLLIDNVEVGAFAVTQRQDDKTEFHAVFAAVPKDETKRVIGLLRTGADAKFVTDATTFDFPLKGASASLDNMRECVLEAANLAPAK